MTTQRTCFYDTKRTAELLGITHQRLMELVKLELVPMPVLVGKTVLFRRLDIIGWARQLKAADPETACSALWAEWCETNDPRKQDTDKQSASEPERDEICCDCRYYEWETGDDPRGGYCYFHAPRPMLSSESEENGGFHQVYPNVDLTHCCGQFKPMKEPTHAAK